MPSFHHHSRLLPLLLLASGSLAGAGLALTAFEAVVPQAAIAQTKKPTKAPKPSKPNAGQNSGNTAGTTGGETITIDFAPAPAMTDGGGAQP